MSSADPALRRPSKTADLAAAIRAVHLRRASPPLFVDDLAESMCGPFWRRVVSSRVLSWLVIDVLLRRLVPTAPVVFTRARYGEDHAEAAAERGVDQYVIVGAGHETFAMRRKDLMARLTVFELDQAGTQETKRRRMREAGIPEPEGVRYIAADLNTETLHGALERAGFDATRPALFSWFGVTYYLGRDAIRETLESIATRMAPGSSVMFDYLADADSTPAEVRELRARSADFVARRGEPWISSFSPGEVPDFLADIGYTKIEHLEPSQVGTRYATGQPGLVYPPFFGLCHAATEPGSSPTGVRSRTGLAETSASRVTPGT